MSEPPTASQTAAAPNEATVRRLIGAGLAARLLIDTGVQMFFPFLPIMAQGLGGTAVAMGRLVSVRSAVGLLAPLSSPLTERRGYRFVLQLGLIVSALGYVLVGASSTMWLALPGMILAGLGTFTFVPTLSAYLSTRLPYARRGRGLAIVEMGWSLAGIIGLFIVGELIARTSWRVPLFVVSGGLLLAAIYYRSFPAARSAPAATHADGQTLRPWTMRIVDFFRLGANRSSAWATLLVQGLVMFGGMHIIISYGTWLVEDFGLGPAQLGRVALVLGVGDLTGATLVALRSDRLGKRYSALLSTGAAALGFLVLPFASAALVTAVGALFLSRIAFEASVVSIIPLLSEQVPEQRSKIMALGTTFGLLGSTLAGLTGPLAFERYAVWGMAAGAAALLVGLVLLWTHVRETAV